MHIGEVHLASILTRQHMQHNDTNILLSGCRETADDTDTMHCACAIQFDSSTCSKKCHGVCVFICAMHT